MLLPHVRLAFLFGLRPKQEAAKVTVGSEPADQAVIESANVQRRAPAPLSLRAAADWLVAQRRERATRLVDQSQRQPTSTSRAVAPPAPAMPAAVSQQQTIAAFAARERARCAAIVRHGIEVGAMRQACVLAFDTRMRTETAIATLDTCLEVDGNSARRLRRQQWANEINAPAAAKPAPPKSAADIAAEITAVATRANPHSGRMTLSESVRSWRRESVQPDTSRQPGPNDRATTN